MNDFLNAEQRLRLKCVFLHSELRVSEEREMSYAEIGFVLGYSTYKVQRIEDGIYQKLKRRRNQKFSQILKELDL